MCRNHRGFVDASVAAAKLGADLLYLNTAFAGPQLVDVLEREKPAVVIHDEEFTGLLGKAADVHRVLAWRDDPDAAQEQDLDDGRGADRVGLRAPTTPRPPRPAASSS